MFLEAFFSHSRKLFSKFPYKIFVIALHEIIGLQNVSLSFCISKSRITMCNLHWCYTFFTGVTLFALVLHLNCTALSQSESSNFFMCIFNCENWTDQLDTSMGQRKKSKSPTVIEPVTSRTPGRYSMYWATRTHGQQGHLTELLCNRHPAYY